MAAAAAAAIASAAAAGKAKRSAAALAASGRLPTEAHQRAQSARRARSSSSGPAVYACEGCSSHLRRNDARHTYRTGDCRWATTYCGHSPEVGDIFRPSTPRASPLRLEKVIGEGERLGDALSKRLGDWAKHDELWLRFQKEPPCPLSLSTVPWPPDEEHILAYVERLQAPGQPRKAYQLACRRWHPDKFLQQFGALIPQEELSEVSTRVNHIFQAVGAQWERSEQQQVLKAV
eukprot:TRINITY_DN12338_c0_g1_i1.p1 TRINITY_DN12338_c0_g1~~TRINITY_DN12338_c0_g1_i1.p1  ORF type:complete len:233 (-),score=45.52 TRINITY_DN12338_c0_g1_i1:358-1056(-)